MKSVVNGLNLSGPVAHLMYLIHQQGFSTHLVKRFCQFVQGMGIKIGMVQAYVQMLSQKAEVILQFLNQHCCFTHATQAFYANETFLPEDQLERITKKGTLNSLEQIVLI